MTLNKPECVEILTRSPFDYTIKLLFRIAKKLDKHAPGCVGAPSNDNQHCMLKTEKVLQIANRTNDNDNE